MPRGDVARASPKVGPTGRGAPQTTRPMPHALGGPWLSPPHRLLPSPAKVYNERGLGCVTLAYPSYGAGA